MALLAFPTWRPFPIERRINGLLDCMLRDFDETGWPLWQERENFGKIVDNQKEFGVEMDVSHFRPEDLSVKVQDGGELCIEGHHKERSDQHGSIERHFIRKYTIPKTVLLDSVESHLSNEGMLRVTAKKKAIEGSQCKNIPIQAAPSTDNNKNQ